MKLSKIVSCLVPIATIGVTTPILTSCGGNNLVLTFGDSINCLSQEKEYTDVAAYHNYDEVFAAVKRNANQQPAGDIKISDIEASKTFQSAYWDFVASMLKANYIVCFNNVLDTTSKPKFTTFNLDYAYRDTPSEITPNFGENVDESSFTYSAEAGTNHVRITISTNSFNFDLPSYTYQNCIVKS